MVFGCVAGIVKGTVKIGAPVVKGGEEEASLWGADQPVGAQVAEHALFPVEGQSIFAQLDWANAAQDVGIHFLGGVFQHGVILSAVRYVVAVAGEED